MINKLPKVLHKPFTMVMARAVWTTVSSLAFITHCLEIPDPMQRGFECCPPPIPLTPSSAPVPKSRGLLLFRVDPTAGERVVLYIMIQYYHEIRAILVDEVGCWPR